ncbi:MAG TPA: S41 family peptidase, partial [Acidobacteriota bacterium]|nr:S41 family peptidase [Acidobacteriota bacterium]
ESWYQGQASEVAPLLDKPYVKPVVVLISPRTFSAAEDFAVAFDAMKRGTLIGEPTGGSTGQPLNIQLPGGGGARICTKRDTYPDGKEFVGVGIQPQILVKPTLADFRADQDRVLLTALDEVKRLRQAAR